MSGECGVKRVSFAEALHGRGAAYYFFFIYEAPRVRKLCISYTPQKE